MFAFLLLALLAAKWNVRYRPQALTLLPPMPLVEKTVGFVGCGNMAECVMSGMLRAGTVPPQAVYVCNRTELTVKRLKETYGVNSDSATGIAKKCDIVFIGVKPYGVTEVLDSIKGELNNERLVVSMAAGVGIDTMEKHLPKGQPLIRVMPNVPSSVGMGMTSLTPNRYATETHVATVAQIFNGIGKTCVVAESSIHAVVGVAGSSPAYTFMYLEALADGAVRGGIPRAQAYEMAGQAVMGAAKMLLESNKTPGALKDMVCSPGGTTIEAVRFLEKGGFRSAVIEAMIECMGKSREMEQLYKE